MSVAFVFDEHFRGVYLATVRRHNADGGPPLDATEVGEPGDLPTGTPDPDLLAWAAANGRIVVTRDYGTMAAHLADRLAAGHSSPGVFLVRPRTSLAVLTGYLAIATHAGYPAEFADVVTYVP